MKKPLRFLFEHLIDYAGLFPPAELTMEEAVRNYAAYRQSEWAWMLGRFIVPVARLEEFGRAAWEFQPLEKSVDAWKLSSLGGANLQSDLEAVKQFNLAADEAAAVMIDTLEFKASTVDEVQAVMREMPMTLTCFIEIPIHENPTELIRAIGAAGAFAKVRTGGVTADAFPSSQNFARFLAVCAEEDVAFKATAGLHHPLRSVNRLTYKPDSASACMHGFLNVFLAAGFAQNGMDAARLVKVLEETSLDAFRFEPDAVFWRDEMLVIAHVRNTRNLFAMSFGSCSFTEPIEDLQKLHLL